MIARQLETIIERQISKFGISNQPWGHVAKRFESLRAYGLLPRGKVRNSQHLNPEEIVAGILSIIASNIGFAGHTALILKGLRPLGGENASFFKTETFCKALEKILTDESALNSLIKVSISDSEIYTNSHCRAAIYYKINGEEKVAYYLPGNGFSLLREGAEKDYDPSKTTSSVINEIAFHPAFFRSIFKNLKYEASMPRMEYPEEPDTDEAIERQKRVEYIGATSHSTFLNMAVDCQVTWPKEETLIEYDGYKLVLMPKTKENTTSVHIDLYQRKLTYEQARTIIHRFLSMLTWCDDQYAVVQDGWSGNPLPVPISKRDLAFATAHHWGFNRKKPNDPDVAKAIAIFREGRNAEQNFLVSYAVLSYYKIIEIRHKDKEDDWFQKNYPLIKDKLDKEIIDRFESNWGTKKTVEKYLTVLCRHAVAHVGDPHNIDPDDYEELGRLHTAAQILRELAKYLIKNEMKLSEHYLDGT